MTDRFGVKTLMILLCIILTVNTVLPAYALDDGQDPFVCADDTAESADDEEYSGYFEIPGKGSVSLVDDGISFEQIDTDMVEGEETYASSAFSAGENEELTSAFPYPYEESEQIASYYTEKYPVNRNQNPYGSCWAHSAMALTEFYMINHGLTDYGVDIDLSELHMCYYCYNQGTPSIAGDTGDTVSFSGAGGILNAGGNLDFASQTLMNGRGAVSENGAPYINAGRMNAGEYVPEASEYSSVAILRNSREINIENKELIKQCIRTNGAVGVSIYSMDSCYNAEFNSYYCATQVKTNHAVCLVGWDDDFPAQNFKASGGAGPEANGAWLVRNSWNYGNSGVLSYYTYFWLSYEDSSLTKPNGSSEKSAWTFDIALPSDMPKNNYFYTSQIHSKSYILKPYCANVFKANSGADYEDIKAVSFDALGLEGDGTAYEISIYTGVNPAKGPASGVKAENATTAGRIYLDGKYTIELKEPVTVKKGECFAVVVKRSDDKTICYERAYSRSNGIVYDVGCSAGQSFFSEDGIEWTDVLGSSASSKRSNFVINALTDDSERRDPDPDPVSVGSAFSPVPDMSGEALYLIRGQRFDIDPAKDWRSDDTGIVNINRKHQLVAKSEGHTLIKSADGESYGIYVSKPHFSQKKITLTSGESIDLDNRFFACVNGSDMREHYPVYYYSTSPDVVRIEDGKATALCAGDALIYAVMASKSFSIRLKVSDEKNGIHLSAAEEEITLMPMQSIKLRLDGYKFKNMVWNSDLGMKKMGSGAYADSVACISPAGKLTAIGAGTTQLRCSNGVKIKLNVMQPKEREIHISPGGSKKIRIKGVKNSVAGWKSLSDNVISVSKKGTVKALNAGMDELECFYDPYQIEGAGFKFRYKVYVEEPSLDIYGDISRKGTYTYSLVLKKGEEYLLSYKEDERNMVFEPPVYKSSNALCAYADENGVVHGLNRGSTVLVGRIGEKKLKIRVNVR